LSSIPSSPLPPASQKPNFIVPPVYTPFTPSLPVDPADPLLDSSEIVMSQEPIFDFSVQPSFFPPLTPESSNSSGDEGISDSSAASPSDRASDSANCSESTWEKPLQVRFVATTAGEKRKADKLASKSSKSKRLHSSGGSHSKRREKMYRCPVRLTLHCLGSLLMVSYPISEEWMRESEFGIIIFLVKIDRFLRLILIPMD
jgi:hypothetical protein